MKQSTWETWFVVSFILCISTFFVGTLDNSRQITSYPYIAVGVVIQFLVCLYYGKNNYED